MYHIRTTKTASQSIAVQVVIYQNRKIIVKKHIGSAKNKEKIDRLKKMAQLWIEQNSDQLSLFPISNNNTDDIWLEHYEYTGTFYSFIYEILNQILNRFNFESIENKFKLFFDLAIMRIVKPASKLQSLELLKEYFNISYRRQNFYEYLSEFIILRDQIEHLVTNIAVKEFNFDFSLIFYDVTTLYFETFKSDELRKTGFSKDNKANQPQITIGLVVNNLGFPVAYEIFEGNKYEGHTILPVIKAFKEKHQIDILTVVADAAMISHENITQLKKHNLQYIVAARLGNLSKETILNIHSTLIKKDKTSIRISTNLSDLVCDFSEKRFKKDNYELEKNIARAENLLKNHSELGKNNKFIKNVNQVNYILNTDLIEKHKLLLGIKGYYTNLNQDISNDLIIERYHDLWHVEQAFRISKHDLEMRPIYHFKEQSIKVHILICFVSLAISKYIEIKTGMSIQNVVKKFLKVTDAYLLNSITNKIIIKRTKLSDEANKILKKLKLSY